MACQITIVAYRRHSNHSDLFTNLNEPFQTEYFDNILITPTGNHRNTPHAHGAGAANVSHSALMDWSILGFVVLLT